MSFIYYTDRSRFSICDRELCDASERTFDVNFFDMANNKELLDVLHLYYMNGNYGVTYTFESRAKWFCGYITALANVERSEGMRKKLEKNPIVRLLVMDDGLIEKINGLLKPKDVTVNNTQNDLFNELCDYLQMFFKTGFKIDGSKILIGKTPMGDSHVRSLVEKLKTNI